MKATPQQLPGCRQRVCGSWVPGGARLQACEPKAKSHAAGNCLEPTSLRKVGADWAGYRIRTPGGVRHKEEACATRRRRAPQGGGVRHTAKAGGSGRRYEKAGDGMRHPEKSCGGIGHRASTAGHVLPVAENRCGARACAHEGALGGSATWTSSEAYRSAGEGGKIEQLDF